MHSFHIRSIVMVFVIMLPLTIPTAQAFNNDLDQYEHCENKSNEEQNEEREAEEEIDGLEDYFCEGSLFFIFKQNVENDAAFLNTIVQCCCSDILTPPPKQN